MHYAQVNSSLRKGALVALKPTNWGKPYQELFDQTDVSGYELWLAESSNNFNNATAKAMRALHNRRGSFALILHDTAEEVSEKSILSAVTKLMDFKVRKK